MSRFPQAFMEELKDRILLSDIVGRKVKLHRRGRQATGLCPFHNEKSPSFHVYDEDGHYHCFGCGQHGDAIGFLMQSEGLPFADAVEKLAKEAGLALPKPSPEEEVRFAQKQNLYTVMEFAARFFSQRLMGAEGGQARDYLRVRGISAPFIEKFRIGFAPDRRFQLRQVMLKENIPEPLALEAGLLIRPENGSEPYDRFRGRIMFPIFDRQNRVIAFGGRMLGEEKGKPKYLNSPETPLFQKGRELYGLSFAVKSAREKSRLIVVEGYMDVIALVQAGIEETVAPLGTALTEQQLQLLWRYVPEPHLCFDGDQAGENAALRGAERALPMLKPGLSCRLAWMPKGEDPDSLIRTQGVQEFINSLARAESLADFLWRRQASSVSLTTPERKAGFRKRILALVQNIADSEVREAYRKDYLTRLDLFFSPPSLRGNKSKLFDKKTSGGEGARRGTAHLYKRQYEALLLVLIHHPDLLEHYGEDIASLHWPPGLLDNMKNAILEQSWIHPHLESRDIVTHLNERGLGASLHKIMQSNLESFAAKSAAREHAERGFVHVLELIREAAARERELNEGVQELASNLSSQSWAAFKARSEWSLAGEGKRRDIDHPIVADIGTIKKLRNKNGK